VETPLHNEDMLMKKFIAGLFLASTVALPLTTFATPAAPEATGKACCEHADRGHHGKHGFQGRDHARDGKPFFLRGLTLSTEQDGKLQALLQAQQPALQAKHDAARKATRALHALGLDGKVDEQQAQRLAQAAATANADAAVTRARLHAQVLQLLTPEQRQQIAQRMQEKAAKRAAREAAAGKAAADKQ
jgi:Spy/CpxP family protein refolding chaperone